MTVSHWTIGPDGAGLRLDKFLAAADRLGSRARAGAAIDRGKVFVNDAEVAVGGGATRLASGDRVRLWMDRPGSATRRLGPRQLGELHILYEDAALIVLNKPPGLLVVPLEGQRDTSSVSEQIEDHLRSHRRQRPLVVHRIDRDTSGLVVFAKHGAAQARLKEQFKRREPERIYRAVVYGHLAAPAGTWRDALVWDRTALMQRKAHPRDPRAKEAISEYQVVETFRDASLIEVRLVTGKRNQIRIQARLRGHALVGERRYVVGPERLCPIPFPRQALHAYRLAFQHPDDGRPLAFEAPLPDDLAALIARLRRG